MALIFPTAPGSIVALEGDHSSMAPTFAKTVAVDGFNAFSEYLSVINRVYVNESTNAQFLHTLGGDIYIYTFGDRLGTLTISGMSFEAQCGGSNGGALGIERVRQFWRKNRLSARAKPVTINIGTRTTFQGYLESFKADGSDPQNRIFQYELAFRVAPDSNSGNDGNDGETASSDSGSQNSPWGGGEPPAGYDASTNDPPSSFGPSSEPSLASTVF